MKKWEYILMHRFAAKTATLNKYGEEGWEIVAVTEETIVFKRIKKEGPWAKLKKLLK